MRRPRCLRGRQRLHAPDLLGTALNAGKNPVKRIVERSLAGFGLEFREDLFVQSALGGELASQFGKARAQAERRVGVARREDDLRCKDRFGQKAAHHGFTDRTCSDEADICDRYGLLRGRGLSHSVSFQSRKCCTRKLVEYVDTMLLDDKLEN